MLSITKIEERCIGDIYYGLMMKTLLIKDSLKIKIS